MKRWSLIVLVLLMFAALAAPPAAAQGPTQLYSLRVGLWPEYDQPSMLVIYWGVLPAGTTFPAVVNLRIPASVSAPHVVAAQPDPEAQVDEVSYETSVEGEWRVVTFQTNGPNFQFEYYAPLAGSGSEHSYTYQWPGEYAVGALTVEVQRPLHTDSFTVDPDIPVTTGDDGLTYHRTSFGALEAGQPLAVSLNYTREETLTTVELLQMLSQEEAGSTAAGTTGTAGIVQTTPVNALTTNELLLIAIVAVASFIMGALAMRLAFNRQLQG